ncbi:MAG: prepilin-type N-terminal cleavage/methylation domain-containing protein [Cyclobacteriaceae bacterium]|nr:prepilin-type N-terminal cleavage/methylation domain-containing protein [Cyclobacteriaceae bacterium HetDA_MAG_MS6]
MYRGNRIPAFTLTELMVVLIISSILLTFVVSSFYYITQYHQGLQKRIHFANEIWRLEYMFRRDLQRNHGAIFGGEEVMFPVGAGVRYLWTGDSTIRRTSDFEERLAIGGFLDLLDTTEMIRGTLVLGDSVTRLSVPFRKRKSVAESLNLKPGTTTSE